MGRCLLCWCLLSFPHAALPASGWGRSASGRGVASPGLVLVGGLVGLAPRRSRPCLRRALAGGACVPWPAPSGVCVTGAALAPLRLLTASAALRLILRGLTAHLSR